ncbi:MAG: LytTR family transcriptional regulator [Bacteroidales bacterium]|nr:LytTR family transcriptional regulator [Bacteroidales bacterium]
MLFFQPFSSRFSDLNSVLLFNAGFGVIIFLLLHIIHILSRAFRERSQEILSYFNGFALTLLGSVAFVFYLRYVGQINIGFYTVLKVALICLAPPVILRIYRLNHDLKQENDVLWKENSHLQNRLSDLTDQSVQKFFEFYSADTNAEILKLDLSDIVLIRSADNYVEIYYRDQDNIKKKLIRNTLKNIEQLMSPHDQFIRCHRTSIINVIHIEKLHLKIDSSFIVVKKLNEHIPVSRQYLLKLKEAVAKRQG